MALSKQKTQILLGLETGRKLHELMREPGMPSKALLDEWRDNDPEFEAAYQAAEEQGRVKRGEPKPKPKPAPVVTDMDGNKHAIPRSTALLRESAPAPVAVPESRPILVVTLDEAPSHAVTHPVAPTPVEVAAENADIVFRDKILALRQGGAKTTWLLKNQRGFNGNKLAHWRGQDPAFKAAWDATRQGGDTTKARAAALQIRQQERASSVPEVPPTESLPVPPTEVVGILRQLVDDYAKEHSITRVAAALKEQVIKLQAFKDYVHGRLTQASIGQHEAANELNGCRIGARLDEVFYRLDAYKEYQTDHKRLVRELDVALFGEENAAEQASLSDLIRPAKKMRDDLDHFIKHDEQQHADVAQQAKGLGTTASLPQHPGLLLADLLRQSGTPRQQLATALGIKGSTLRNLLQGKYGLNLTLCAKLEKLCWGTAETWCRRQVDFDNHRLAQPVA